MKRILIIDDQEDVREELRDRIASMGYEADEAASQEEALGKLRELAYDCVLLDLQIPLTFEGIARLEHGRNLLQRIVAMPAAPPVIVITSHYGPRGHKLAMEMVHLGAASFVGKPFEDDPVEPKIEMVLGRKAHGSSAAPASERPFTGGALVLNEDGIELCEVTVGGVRSNSIIRRVIELLAEKPKGRFRKIGAQTFADLLPGSVTPATVTSAIKEFRDQCTEKLRGIGVKCEKNDVIQTVRGGGYQFAPAIEVLVGREHTPASQIDQDCEVLLKQFRRRGEMVVKQARESVAIPAVRVKAALSALVDRKAVEIVSGSGTTTTYRVCN